MRIVGVVALGFIVLVLGCTRSPESEATRSASDTDESVFEQLVHDWCTATLNKDTAFVDRILAEEYRAVSPRGTTETKTEALEALKDPTSTLTVCVENDIRTRIYGDAAVVTGVGRHEGTYKGTPFADPPAIWTDTWVRRDGRWQVVAAHATSITSQ